MAGFFLQGILQGVNLAQQKEQIQMQRENMEYGRSRDAISDQRYENQWQNQLERQGMEDKRYDSQLQYSRGRDQVEDQYRDKQFEFQKNESQLSRAQQASQFDRSYGLQASQLNMQRDEFNRKSQWENEDRELQQFQLKAQQALAGIDIALEGGVPPENLMPILSELTGGHLNNEPGVKKTMKDLTPIANITNNPADANRFAIDVEVEDEKGNKKRSAITRNRTSDPGDPVDEHDLDQVVDFRQALFSSVNEKDARTQLAMARAMFGGGSTLEDRKTLAQIKQYESKGQMQEQEAYVEAKKMSTLDINASLKRGDVEGAAQLMQEYAAQYPQLSRELQSDFERLQSGKATPESLIKEYDDDTASFKALGEFKGNRTEINMGGDAQAPTTATTNKLQADILSGQKEIRNLDTIASEYEDEYLTAWGGLKSAAGQVVDKAGLDTMGLATFNAERSKLEGSVMQFFNQYKKEITGAAAGEKEMKQLLDSMFNPSNGPKEFRARYEQFTAKAEENLAANQTAAREGINIGSSTNSNSQNKITTYTSPIVGDFTEEDINYTMEKYGVTREQAMQDFGVQ
ncbi:MAG: hypothetical protein V4629_02980 [Pseudomonadota bacterium]